MDQCNTIKLKLTKPIVFIGMMGVGKTTIGRALAHRLDMTFYDSDLIVQDRAGMSIPDIFDIYGEPKFRAAEHNAITEILDKGMGVLATGGGAVCNADTLSNIKMQSISVWLKSDITALIERVSKNKNRPLLQTDDPKATLKNLMKTRTPMYEQADIHFDVDHKTIDKAVHDLIQTLYDYGDF